MNRGSMKHIKVSAPGKIILHGEHAVVFKKRALAASLGLRTRLDLRETGDDVVSITMDRFLEKRSWDTGDFSEIIGLVKAEVGPEVTIDEDLVSRLNAFLHCGSNGHADGDKSGITAGPNFLKDIAIIGFLYVVVKLSRLLRLTRAPSVALTITSDIAIGAGLGSSAAFSVCIAASLLFYFGVIQCAPNTSEDVVGKFVPHLDQLVLINHWAFLIESIIHGRASGIDNSVSTYGGIIMYCDQEMTRIPSRLKLDVVVVDTMVQRDTKRMVELVQRRQKLYPSVLNPILDAIDGISEMSSKIMQHGTGFPTPEEYEILSELINMNHNLLCALGVSHPSIDAICAAAQKWGQAAKLTGAGGGGCAIVVLDPDLQNFSHLRESLLSEFRKMDFRPQIAEIGGPGVLFHPLT